MKIKDFEIINTGEGYRMSYGHIDKKVGEPIFTYNTITMITGFHIPTLKELGLNYKDKPGYLLFESVDDCKIFIDYFHKEREIPRPIKINDYTTKYNFK